MGKVLSEAEWQDALKHSGLPSHLEQPDDFDGRLIDQYFPEYFPRGRKVANFAKGAAKYALQMFAWYNLYHLGQRLGNHPANPMGLTYDDVYGKPKYSNEEIADYIRGQSGSGFSVARSIVQTPHAGTRRS